MDACAAVAWQHVQVRVHLHCVEGVGQPRNKRRAAAVKVSKGRAGKGLQWRPWTARHGGGGGVSRGGSV
eukprot:3970998-Pleurochrysis_carterae.AAC.1